MAVVFYQPFAFTSSSILSTMMKTVTPPLAPVLAKCMPAAGLQSPTRWPVGALSMWVCSLDLGIRKPCSDRSARFIQHRGHSAGNIQLYLCEDSKLPQIAQRGPRRYGPSAPLPCGDDRPDPSGRRWPRRPPVECDPPPCSGDLEVESNRELHSAVHVSRLQTLCRHGAKGRRRGVGVH